jgi:murein DD-endopeptidase MepM/ murein hydrolase activator NlpD
MPIPDAGMPPDPEPPPCDRVVVTTIGIGLNVRSAPRLDASVVTTLAEGTVVAVQNDVVGDAVEGETRWFEVETPTATGFITALYAECTTAALTFDGPLGGFRLPLACGMSARISQGNDSAFSHNGLSRYAFDFSIARGTPLHAMAAGVVRFVANRTGPGDPCYNGGGRECIAEANIVRILHADGTVTGYAHLDAALVEVGDTVRSGTVVGRSGTSGWSTGPHAHVAREEDCGGGCQSLPLRFLDVAGDGVPATGDTVTSANCP